MASHLGTETVSVDVERRARRRRGGHRGGRGGASTATCCSGVDVGGDVLARGDEPGLASPLCDAVMVAAALAAGERLSRMLAVVGPGCDGELTVDEVLERVAALGRAGAWLGTWGVTPEIADELEAAAQLVPTEASLQVARCARGEFGETRIRGGRRRVELGPVGALTFVFDPALAARSGELPLVRRGGRHAQHRGGSRRPRALGVHTELDYERDRGSERPLGGPPGTGARVPVERLHSPRREETGGGSPRPGSRRASCAAARVLRPTSRIHRNSGPPSVNRWPNGD